MKLYNYAGYTAELVLPEGRYVIHPEGTDIPDEIAKKILERFQDIKDKPVGAKKKEVRKDG